MTKSDLHRRYADALDLCEKHGISQALAVGRHEGHPYLSSEASDYLFLLAVIEGKPVYVGDKLWNTVLGSEFIVTDLPRFSSNMENWSFEKPKPKTFTLNGVELIAPDNRQNGYFIGDIAAYKWDNHKDRDAFYNAIIDLLDGKQGDL